MKNLNHNYLVNSKGSVFSVKLIIYQLVTFATLVVCAVTVKGRVCPVARESLKVGMSRSRYFESVELEQIQ